MSYTYLCGGINELTDGEGNDWRAKAKALLKTETLDPMRRDWRGKERESSSEIVLSDLMDLNYSDYVLINATKPSWGTAIEVVYANQKGCVTIAFVGKSPNPSKDSYIFAHVSPRLIYHCDAIFETLEEAVNKINESEAEAQN